MERKSRLHSDLWSLTDGTDEWDSIMDCCFALCDAAGRLDDHTAWTVWRILDYRPGAGVQDSPTLREIAENGEEGEHQFTLVMLADWLVTGVYDEDDVILAAKVFERLYQRGKATGIDY